MDPSFNTFAASVSLILLYSALAQDIELPPWYGNQAVLPPVFAGAMESPGTEVYGFTGPTVSRLKLRFDSVPPMDISPEKSEAGRKISWHDGDYRPQAKSSYYRISVDDFRSEKPGLRESGSTFSVSILGPKKGMLAGTNILVTNLTVGPVWLMLVDPRRDSINMEALTPAARSRIRVLSFSGSSLLESKGTWISGDVADRMGTRLLCGKVRFWANRVISNPRYANNSVTLGLVLLELPDEMKERDRIVDSHKGFDLIPGLSPASFALEPDMVAGLEALQDAESDAKLRFERSQSNYTAHLIQLKREGKIGDASPVQDWHRWTRFSDGKRSDLPFRVTGVVW